MEVSWWEIIFVYLKMSLYHFHFLKKLIGSTTQDWHLQDAIISFILIFIIAAVLYDLSLFSAFGILLSLLFHSDVFIPGFNLLGKIDLYLWSLVENSQSSPVQLFLFPVLSSFWVQNKCFFFLFFSPYLLACFIFFIFLSLYAALWEISSAKCSNSLFDSVSPVIRPLYWAF